MSEFHITNGSDEINFKSGEGYVVDITFNDGSGLFEDVFFYMDLTQCQELVNFLKNKIAIHHASTGNQ
jgi:hypothetical protein